jgi:hypothetical protein
MAMSMCAASRLTLGLRIFFSEFVRVSLSHPSQALFLAQTVLWEGAAARRRARLARQEGLHVLPIAVFSITKGCTLSPGVWLRPPGLFPTERCNTDVAARPHTVGLQRALDQAGGNTALFAALASHLGKYLPRRWERERERTLPFDSVELQQTRIIAPLGSSMSKTLPLSPGCHNRA